MASESKSESKSESVLISSIDAYHKYIEKSNIDVKDYNNDKYNDTYNKYKIIPLILDSAQCLSRTPTTITWQFRPVVFQKSGIISYNIDKIKIVGMVIHDFYINDYYYNNIGTYTVTIPEYTDDSFYSCENRFHFIGQPYNNYIESQIKETLLSFRQRADICGEYEHLYRTSDSNNGIYMFKYPQRTLATISISIGCPINKMVLFNETIEIESYQYAVALGPFFYTHIILTTNPHIISPKFTNTNYNTRIFITEFRTSDDVANNELIKEITRAEGWIMTILDTNDQTDLVFAYDPFPVLLYPLVGTLIYGKVIVEANQLFIGLNLLYEDIVEDTNNN